MGRPSTLLLQSAAMTVDFAAALAAVERMKHEGVVTEYAIGGAMALVFWTEPVPTFDLDVFVRAEANGFAAEEEHIVINGVPVQFIPSPGALADEAIAEAATLDYQGAPVRVIRPEHLIALYLEPSARTAKRLQRVAALREESAIDRQRLESILRRYNLELPW